MTPMSLPSTTVTSTEIYSDSSSISDNCAICLTSLQNHPVLQLKCGHRWHLHCIREQLIQNQPNASRRLQFNGIRCPLCLKICSHPSIDKLVAPSLTLLNQVYELALKQAAIDQLSNSSISRHRLSCFPNLALETYTFYLCALCQSPFISGVTDCLDQYGSSQATHICVTCLLTSSQHNPIPISKPIQHLCTSPREHQHAFVWKCRFCCQPATVICHNHTHLCQSCHDRDNAVRQGIALKYPPKRCKGQGFCQSIPFPVNVSFHHNGPAIDSELLLYCALCAYPPGKIDIPTQSNTRRTSRLTGERVIKQDSLKETVKPQNSEIENRSPNMLFNPCGKHDMSGWISPYHIHALPSYPGIKSTANNSSLTSTLSSLSSASSASSIVAFNEYDNSKRLPVGFGSKAQKLGYWTVETSNISLADPSTIFVMSSQQACMAQCVDMANFIPTRYSSAVTRIEVSVQYRGTATSSIVQLRAAIYDSRMNEVGIFDSPAVNTTTDHWESIKYCFTLARGSKPRFVVIAVNGEQKETKRLLWNRHNHQIKVSECAVRVLYRNNQKKLFFRNAFTRISHSLVGPIQPIIKMFRLSRNPDGKKEKEKEEKGVPIRREKPIILSSKNLHQFYHQNEEKTEHLFHQRSFSRVSTSLSIGTTTSNSSLKSGSANDGGLSQRGRLSRSFYRSRYRKYF